MYSVKIAFFSLIAVALLASSVAAWYDPNGSVWGPSCSTDQACGEYAASHGIVCTVNTASLGSSAQCSVESNRLCGTACQSHPGTSTYGRCVCAYDTNPSNGYCISESDTSYSTRQSTGLDCYNGGLWTGRCENCGNWLTWCEQGVSNPQESQPSSPSTPESEGSGWEWSSGWGFWWSYPPYCTLQAYPSYIYAGASSEITISYYNLFYAPWGVFVDCGNGHSAYAYGCYGSTGMCYANCNYPQAGTYQVTAYAGGTYCNPTTVHAVGSGSQPSPTPSATPTVYPASCSASTNPSLIEGEGTSIVIVSYSNYAYTPDNALVLCGNGALDVASCSGTSAQGTCIAECTYLAPSSYPQDYQVDAVVEGIQCSPDSVTLYEESYAPSPTPSVEPAECDPVIFVYDSVTSGPIKDATTLLNGQVEFTDENGEAFYYGFSDGDYAARASRLGYQTRTVTANLCEEDYIEIPLNPFLDEACEIVANPGTVRAGSSTIATVYYYEFEADPESMLLDCGNGNTIVAQCDGSAGTGSCTASCGYGEEQAYPIYYTLAGSISGTACASDQVEVIAPLPDTGAILAMVTECDSGDAIQGARIDAFATQQPQIPLDPPTYYTDAYGQATLGNLAPQSYGLTVSKDGFDGESVSAMVYAGETTSVAVCLNEAECDFEIAIISSPDCPYNEEPQPYQVRITNNLDEGQNIFITYSSEHLQGPAAVYLEPHASTIVNLYSNIEPDFAGGNFVIVSFTGNDADCTQNLQLPVCMSGGLEVEALEDYKTVLPGQEACFALLVRNRGTAKAAVVMSSSGNESNWESEFTPSNFYITSQEIKNVEYCVQVPGGASGSNTITIYADSPINDAVETVVVNVAGARGWSTNWGSCRTVDASSTVALEDMTIYNGAMNGNYQIYIGDNELSLSTQENLYNFGKGESREIWFRLNAFGLEAGDYHADFQIRAQDGIVAYQKDLCFRVGGEYVIYSQLIPTTLTVARGAGASAFLKVKNIGRLYGVFEIVIPDAPFATTYASPTTITLEPGQEESVELHFSPSNSVTAGSYTVPVEVWARTRTGSSSGGSGGSSSNDYHEVEFDCDNGYEVDRICYGEDGYCKVTCSYDDEGVYYPTASIEGYECDDWASRVRVLDSWLANTCTVQVLDNNLEEGQQSTVRVNYHRSSFTHDIDVEVDCGNGDDENCDIDSNDDSCDVTCGYDDEGDYSVTATAEVNNQLVTCEYARAVVMDDSSRQCAIATTPNTVLDGDPVTFSIAYYNMPGEDDGEYYEYGDYEYEFLDSNNLLVNVVSTSGFGSYDPQVSSALQVIVQSPIEAPLSGWTAVPVIVKNNNYYSLSSVVLSVSGLPGGVFASPIQPFALAPNEERTIQLYLQSEKAQAGTYRLTLRADSPSMVSQNEQADLVVKPLSGDDLNVAVQQSPASSTTLSGVPALSMSFLVSNNEESVLALTPYFELPNGWNYVLEPQAPYSVAVNNAVEFTVTLTTGPDFDPNENYNATMFVRSNTGKQRVVPMHLKQDEGMLSLGFFTLALSTELALLVLVLLAAGGAYLLYEANEKLKETE